MTNRSVSRFLSALAALAVVSFAANAHADATWQATLHVLEAGGTSADLVFGVDPTGTAGVDAALGEVVQPPLPPAGNFDARFNTGGGLLKDIRVGTTAGIASETSVVALQRAAGGNITLTWNQSALANQTTSAIIQDPFGGGVLFPNVDMRTTGTFTITSAAVTSVSVIFTSVEPFVPPTHTQIVLTGGPSANVVHDAAMAPAFVVTPQTGAGGASATAVSVTAALATGAGTLSGTTTVQAAAGGAATFSNLIYTTSGAPPGGTENFTITFSATDLNGAAITATSAAITADIPNLVAPTLTAIPAAVPGTNQNKDPLLQWSTVGPATGYVVSLGLSPACTSVANAVAVTATQYQAPTLADGNYCWNVASTDGTTTTAASANSTFTTIPTFGDWGMILLIVSMVGVGAFYMRRRVAA